MYRYAFFYFHTLHVSLNVLLKNTYGKCIHQTIEGVVFGIYFSRVMFEELIQKQFQIELEKYY